MSVARTLSRPFWACNTCRSGYLRAFTTSANLELPRQRRRWQDLAPYKAGDYEPFTSSDMHAESPIPDDEVSGNRDATSRHEPPIAHVDVSAVPARKAKQKESPSFRSDGISNVSNRRAPQGLSIPADFVDNEEAPVIQEKRRHPLHQPRSKDAQPEPQKEAADPSEKPMSNLPWYLQPEYQSRPLPPSSETSSTLAEQQQLPPLPAYPPPLLHPILEHLSTEIGLDYLTLLDLRALDPPPALGSNLLMLIGTARSEKHLHVAAARFCAHLRRAYNLHPYADGLLGRNELKIKQKRKAKKARALANAGAAGAESLEALDDGIRTGWVCVHAGYLEPAVEALRKRNEEKRAVVADGGGVIGFGEESNLVTLVVQMFTEERRGEVDLEGLWGKILEKNLKMQEQRKGGDHDGETKVAGDGEVRQESGLTSLEVKARKRFGFSGQTVLDDLPQETGQRTIQAAQ